MERMVKMLLCMMRCATKEMVSVQRLTKALPIRRQEVCSLVRMTLKRMRVTKKMAMRRELMKMMMMKRRVIITSDLFVR